MPKAACAIGRSRAVEADALGDVGRGGIKVRPGADRSEQEEGRTVGRVAQVAEDEVLLAFCLSRKWNQPPLGLAPITLSEDCSMTTSRRHFTAQEKVAALRRH